MQTIEDPGADGFPSYVEQTTMDPGNSILVGTIIFCGLLIVSLPCLISIGNRCSRQESADADSSAVPSKNGTNRRRQQDHDVTHNDSDGESLASVRTKANSVASAAVHAILDSTSRVGPNRRRNRVSFGSQEKQLGVGSSQETRTEDDNKSLATPSVLGRIEQDEVSFRDAVDATDTVCKDTRDLDEATDLGSLIASAFEKLLVIAEWDYESKRLWKIGLPFILPSLVKGISEVARVAIIGRLIGTNAMTAYVLVGLIVGSTASVLGGFHDAMTILCNQAVVRAGNKKLMGEYIQMSMVLYVLFYIPVVIFWVVFIEDTLEWLGLDAATTKLGEDYALVYLFYGLIAGIGGGVLSLVDVIGVERYTTVFTLVQEIVATLATLTVALLPNSTLQAVGYVYIAKEGAALVTNVTIIMWNGWFDSYLEGIIGTFALANRKALKLMLKTSICFSFGYVLTSTKWELMTIFARYLGPAEVTVWGLLGTLWGALEYFTAAISDASEVRTAFLLGIGQPAKARLSTYKSLYYGNFASIVVSACFFIGGDDIATWLTTDDTLQRLLAELIPLFGVGNIALTIGSMAWTLVGAQGRYHLSSAVGLSGIWLISVPLAALFSIYLNLNLQGQTASIVVGYMVSGTVNSYILFRSDWNRLSRQVVQQNAEAEHSVSSLNKEELRPVKREPGGDSHTFKAAKGMNSRHSPSNGQSSQTRSPETN